METFDFIVLSFQSSLGKRKNFSKKKNMEVSKVRSKVEVKLEDILLGEEIPIVTIKSYTINAFSRVIAFTRKIAPLSSEMSYRISGSQQINWANIQ